MLCLLLLCREGSVPCPGRILDRKDAGAAAALPAARAIAVVSEFARLDFDHFINRLTADIPKFIPFFNAQIWLTGFRKQYINYKSNTAQ